MLETFRLHRAIEQNDANTVDRLLKKDEDLAFSTDAHEGLWMAAEHGHVEVVRALIKHGASHEWWHDGETPLHAAARNGNVAVVKLLLESGAEVDVMSHKDGSTPLHLALTSSKDALTRLETVKALTAARANVSIRRGGSGMTPQDVAAEVSTRHGRTLDEEAIVNCLREHDTSGFGQGSRKDKPILILTPKGGKEGK